MCFFFFFFVPGLSMFCLSPNRLMRVAHCSEKYASVSGNASHFTVNAASSSSLPHEGPAMFVDADLEDDGEGEGDSEDKPEPPAIAPCDPQAIDADASASSPSQAAAAATDARTPPPRSQRKGKVDLRVSVPTPPVSIPAAGQAGPASASFFAALTGASDGYFSPAFPSDRMAAAASPAPSVDSVPSPLPSAVRPVSASGALEYSALFDHEHDAVPASHAGAADAALASPGLAPRRQRASRVTGPEAVDLNAPLLSVADDLLSSLDRGVRTPPRRRGRPGMTHSVFVPGTSVQPPRAAATARRTTRATSAGGTRPRARSVTQSVMLSADEPIDMDLESNEVLDEVWSQQISRPFTFGFLPLMMGRKQADPAGR